MSAFDDWYDNQPLVIIDRKTEHRLTWEAAMQQQAADIAERDAVIAKCKETLGSNISDLQEPNFVTLASWRVREALAAIKEEGL